MAATAGCRARRPAAAAAAACCLALVLLLATLTQAIDDRVLRRSNAKKWQRVAEVSRLKARSAARQFLEEANADLAVPIEVEVVLVGFERDGGHGYSLDHQHLLSLLSSHLPWYCPHSWDTEEELGVCLHVNFQVITGEEFHGVPTLLHRLEAHMRERLRESHSVYDEKLADPDTGEEAGGMRRILYIDGADAEPLFDEFLASLYAAEAEADGTPAPTGNADHVDDGDGLGGTTGTGSVVSGGRLRRGRADVWHKHNAIFVINPSKVRINPAVAVEAVASHAAPDFVSRWREGDLNASQLAAEDGGYAYRWTYNGAGESAVWLSSRNYLVIDLAAGPSAFGPLVSQGGAATPAAVPSIHAMYRELFRQMAGIGSQQSARAAGGRAADAAQRTLLAGRLAALLAAATKAAFVPDVATQHLEVAKTVLVPLVVLSDHAITPDQAALQKDDDFWGINVTHVELALGHLLGEGQEAVIISAHHELHQHKQLMAAMHKATRTHSEAVLDPPEGALGYKGVEVGMHVNTHTFVDPDTLLEEIERSADMLTHGLVTVAHTMGKEDEHRIAQLRHEGTRVLPVFVFALRRHPDDTALANRELVAANHDSVIVLQLRHGDRWGGPSEFFTGHTANGHRVTTDARDSTRHVIAGLARALAGVTPPHQHFEPALGWVESDWRFSVGATPFGPYSNYSGVSELMQNAARRNALLTHASAALHQLQHQLDAVDAFVAHHFSGPWDAAGIDGDKKARRHWLDTVAGSRHGFNSSLPPAVVATLEGALGNVSAMLEELAMNAYSHDFALADELVGQRLLPAVAALCTLLDAHLDAAEEVLQCCRVGASSVITAAVQLLVACAGAAALFFVLVGVALCARAARRKAAKALNLPTYGLPQYVGGAWRM